MRQIQKHGTQGATGKVQWAHSPCLDAIGGKESPEWRGNIPHGFHLQAPWIHERGGIDRRIGLPICLAQSAGPPPPPSPMDRMNAMISGGKSAWTMEQLG